MPALASTRTTQWAGGLLLAAACGLPASAWADIFHLTSGGQIEGELLNREEQPRHEYRVRTASGVTVALPLDQVRETVLQSAAEAEYARRAPLAADTVEGQWALAEWCRKQGLARQRQTHLARVIELDPNHQQARYLLGYQFLHGEWITREAFRRSEGYEYYRGKWRTPQEIEILEERSRLELVQKEWLMKLRRWRRDLNDPAKARAARASLVAIKDPAAVRPLASFFARERLRPVKFLYADILASINTSDAVGVLVERTLSDPDEEVYHYCVDRLVQLQPPEIAEPFIKRLKDQNNIRVNRAGAALGRIGNRTAIAPLIDALVTTHTQVLPGPPGTSSDTTTTGFSDDGTVFKQGEGPKLLVAHVSNQAVLDALEKLTGVNFGFDQKAWRYWHAQEKIAREANQPPLDARRQ